MIGQDSNNPRDGSLEPVTEETAQVALFTDDEALLVEDLDPEVEDFLDGLLDYDEQPLLLVDTDPERAVARQKELMDFCFGGIGEERKAEKRLGLAMQQLDVEQRHALRLLLIYQDPAELAAHLERCLADPAYGYGERGDNGRTIALAMAGLLAEDPAGGSLAELATAWLTQHREFQQRVLSGVPLSFRSLFDYGDLDSFVPLLQRVAEMTWRLGVEGEGKHRDFQGTVEEMWPQLCDTYVQWLDEDNDTWLADLKRKATRLPDTILRAARADRLRRETERIEIKGELISLVTEREGEPWPRMITMANQKGVGLLGLSRLSGHNFYELTWAGGLHVRRFEISSTTRHRVRFEHIELATMLAETLGTEADLRPEPVTPAEVKAAYLRRMKAEGVELGAPAPDLPLPRGTTGQPAAVYRVGEVQVTMLFGGPEFAYATAGDPETGVLLRRDDSRGVMVALPVRQGRPRRDTILMTTPRAELNLTDSQWNRALCAWAAWLAWGINKG
ncbi:MAG TPA: hypothetical protein VGD99_05915 [Anaerolineae bacterium]